MAHDETSSATLRLWRAVDPDRDHMRGVQADDAVVVVAYQDFLCPYCRRLREQVWEWAARNLSAASARLSSPAERIERALAPWSAYVILPAFAFSATGVRIAIDFWSHDAGRIFTGIAASSVNLGLEKRMERSDHLRAFADGAAAADTLHPAAHPRLRR
jgi:Na+/H+ antiporter NhaA